MVFVEGGCFEMGDPYPQTTRLDGDPDEKPTPSASPTITSANTRSRAASSPDSSA